MNQEGYIEAFFAWIRQNEAKLNTSGITVQVPEKITPSGTHADFFSETGEATVEVWDYGFSEFHVVNYEAANLNRDYPVATTHYEFQNKEEFYTQLRVLMYELTPSLAVTMALSR